MSLRSILIGALLVAVTIRLPSVQAGDAVTLTALASEGIMIRSGETVILIDAFVDPHETEGDSALMAVREAMFAGRPPFSSVDLALISHPHHEHFHAGTAGMFLKNHQETILASSTGIIEAVRNEFPSDSVIDRQLVEIRLDKEKVTSITLAGVEVDFIPFRHEASMLYPGQVLGHILHLEEKTILYVGDAEMRPENWQPYDLKFQDIDIALIPEWLFAQEVTRDIIDKYVSPDKVVVVQIPPAGYEKKFTKIVESYPNVLILNKAMDSIKF